MVHWRIKLAQLLLETRDENDNIKSLRKICRGVVGRAGKSKIREKFYRLKGMTKLKKYLNDTKRNQKENLPSCLQNTPGDN